MFLVGCEGRGPEPLVEELRTANRVESASIYEEGAPSKVHAVYEKLLQTTSREDLVRLLDDKSPVVRVYAFWGLKAKFPAVDLFGLLKVRLGDSTPVETLFGCIEETQQVADLLIRTLEEELTPEQKRELLTWMVRHPNNLATRERALRQWPLSPKHHAPVRKLAEAGAAGALVALARFGDDADLPVIARQIGADSFDSLEAVERNPRPALFPILAAMHRHFLDMDGRSSEMEQYYRAVAAFRTPAAAKLLAAVLETPSTHESRSYHIQFAFEAVIAYRDAYTDLLFRFWESSALPHLAYSGPAEGPYEEDRIIADLWKADSQRTMRVIRSQFGREDFHNHSELALHAMVRVLLRELKPDEAFAVINRGLAAATVHQLPVLAGYAARYRPDSSIPVLFDRLLKPDNPHVQVSAAQTILAYGRKDLRERMQRLLAEGAIPKNDWGRDRVREILQSPPADQTGPKTWIGTVIEKRIERR
ncbi:MAG: hypothetical protein AMS16_07325 [Planctomycetes bacterium DG_58]|nr:MAG: hypothetical protein AMS16_07325 [Planctomycetes bacterium DG_58]